MPSKDPAQAFEDSIDKIGRIAVDPRGLTYQAYAVDHKTIDAVERCLARISEAAVRRGDDGASFCPGIAWADRCGIGIRLRHADQTIDQRMNWRVGERELTRLRTAGLTALERLDRRRPEERAGS